MPIEALKAALQALQEAEAGLEFAGADKPHEGDFVPAPKLALQKVRAAISSARAALAAPSAHQVSRWTQADADEWGARHDIKLSGDALFCAFEDAATLAAPSAEPPAPIAGVTAIYCGWGCSCVTQCGDTYDYAGQPKPPLKPATPAQPPAAQPVTTFEPWHLLKHRILPPGTAPTSSLHWGDEQAAAPSVAVFAVAQMHGYARSCMAAAPKGPVPDALTDAARDVLAERQRQVSVEGWTPDHDDAHDDGSLACAASCYACAAAGLADAERDWPWNGGFKPADPRRMLVKAGALILAEIERLDRTAARGAK